MERAGTGNHHDVVPSAPGTKYPKKQITARLARLAPERPTTAIAPTDSTPLGNPATVAGSPIQATTEPRPNSTPEPEERVYAPPRKPGRILAQRGWDVRPAWSERALAERSAAVGRGAERLAAFRD